MTWWGICGRCTLPGEHADQQPAVQLSNNSQSNQPDTIRDVSGNLNYGAKTAVMAYTYRGDGQVKNDGRTGDFISYNLLALPQTVTGTDNITYWYDADGDKLAKVSTKGSITTRTDYIGGIQYTSTNGATPAVEFIQTGEGRARLSGSKYIYEYDLTDHLGNARLTFATSGASPVVVQTTDYYPFGMTSNETLNGTKSKYLYNKKELQEETNQYDYGARFYDPVIARWTSIDPLAETSRRHSTYAYGLNNPIMNIDPDGMEVVETAQCTTYTGADAQAAFAQLQSQQQPQQDNKSKDQSDDVVVKDPIVGQSSADDGGRMKDGGGKKDGGQENGNGDGKQSLPDMKENPPNVPGYKPPKSGARKVRNPNGKGTGWVDRNGRVWVPDDHDGTHAPHWDVQDPKGGGYTPVYPTVTVPVADPSLRQRIGDAVGLSGVGLTIYLIISEGSRLFPPRNLVPVP